MGEIRDYSVTADDNNDTPPAGAPEGMAPSTVNNTMREAYARIKRWYDDAQGAKTTAGSSNTYTLAAARTVSSYAAGDNYVIKANHSNTGAATLNVDSVGAKAIVTPALNALEADSIRAGGVYQIAYEASADKFILVNGAHPSESQITLKNPTSEDTSGGRESQVVFKGLQSGGEESTLVKIQASHEGTSDDEKGQLIVGVNDGDDGASPTTAVTVASTGIVTFDKMPITPNPTFRVYRNSDQTGISDASFTKVQFDTVAYDARNEYDESTNYRYSPTIPGVYSFFAAVRVGNSVNTHQCFVALYKNGSKILQTNIRIASSDDLVSSIVPLAVHDTTDGDDYYEIFVYLNTNGSNGVFAGSSSGFNTYFGGTLISRTT